MNPLPSPQPAGRGDNIIRERVPKLGVIDAKGGDVVLLHALKALHEVGALNDTSVTVVLTGDEEDSGKPIAISRAALKEAAKNAEIALYFEWAITPKTATIARRGITNWLLETSGHEAHSAEIFQAKAGFGAIYEMARILNALQVVFAHEKYVSLSPGLIFGGTTLDYDATHSAGKADLRFLTPKQQQNALKKMAVLVNLHLPGTDANITFQEGIPAMLPTKHNLDLLRQYSQVLGKGSVTGLDPGLCGAGDISHIAQDMQASLAGLGPVGTNCHSTDETLELASLSLQTERSALLMYRLTRGLKKQSDSEFVQDGVPILD